MKSLGRSRGDEDRGQTKNYIALHASNTISQFTGYTAEIVGSKGPDREVLLPIHSAQVCRLVRQEKTEKLLIGTGSTVLSQDLINPQDCKIKHISEQPITGTRAT
jgi:hypothetical protein